MRLLLALGFVMVSGAAAPATPAPAAAARGALVPWQTRAWHTPVAVAAGVSGSERRPAGTPDLTELAAQMAARRAALARVPVQVRANGSRFAVVGGLARRYLVARVGEDGALSESCVESEADAERLVRPAGKER
jgi:hypothetical protein